MTCSNNWNIQDGLKGKSLEVIQGCQKALSQPFSIAIINIEGGLNISTIIRTACLFGAEKAFIYGRPRFDRRGMVGAQNYIPIIKYEDEHLDFYKFEKLILEENDYYPIFCETGGQSITDFDLKEFRRKVDLGKLNKPCFVFGNESVGIPAHFLNKLYPILSIKQFSVMRSLNVAVAAGIIMHAFVGG